MFVNRPLDVLALGERKHGGDQPSIANAVMECSYLMLLESSMREDDVKLSPRQKSTTSTEYYVAISVVATVQIRALQH